MKTWQLRQRQSLPLDAKLVHAEQVIRKWYEYWDGDVCVSFSGGKDSTVLLDIVRSVYPDTPAVFVNTGLEYPEIVKFVKTIEQVDIIRPKMNFRNVPVCERGGTMSNWTLYEGGGLVYDLSGVGGRWGS